MVMASTSQEQRRQDCGWAFHVQPIACEQQIYVATSSKIVLAWSFDMGS